MPFNTVVNSELTAAIDHFKSRAGLAKALGVTVQTVYDWTGNKRPMPLERAIQIEQLTAGKVRADRLVAEKAGLIGYLRSSHAA